DLDRVCAKHGVRLRQPSRFPRNGLLAARVALLGADEPWGPDFVRAVYRANFADDREISDQQVIASLLDELTGHAAGILQRARAPDNKARLRKQTEQATALGIFGAPSFVSRGELFWGNDRLEDALGWHRAPA